MKTFLVQFFTWWNGQTIGTRFWTWRKGELVGEDAQGNHYYRQRGGSQRWGDLQRRGRGEPHSAEWHGWIHHRIEEPPAKDYRPREWQKPHEPNLTGTAQAYRPPGSVLNRARTTRLGRITSPGGLNPLVSSPRKRGPSKHWTSTLVAG